MNKLWLVLVIVVLFCGNALAQDAAQPEGMEAAPAMQVEEPAPYVAPEPEAAPMPTAAPAAAPANAPEVARVAFATGIENREPVETITDYYPVEGGTVYFFTELRNMENTQVYHVWYKNGEEVYRFRTNVGSARWRTNSSMKAAHFKSGDEVIVEVIGIDDTVYEKATLAIN